MLVTAYTDGACKGNDKSKLSPGGWGFFYDFFDGSYTIRFLLSGGERNTTNQKMELQALLELLKEIPSGHETHIYSDSHYVLKGFASPGMWGKPIEKYSVFDGWIKGWKKKDYKDVKNVERWKEIDRLFQEHFKRGTVIYLNYVKGHSGDPGNDLADRLSNEGASEFMS